MTYFYNSRPINQVAVYTSCDGLKQKYTKHFHYGTPDTGHGLPLNVVSHIILNNEPSYEQKDGRNIYEYDGYKVVVSSSCDGEYVPIVTAYMIR